MMPLTLVYLLLVTSQARYALSVRSQYNPIRPLPDIEELKTMPLFQLIALRPPRDSRPDLLPTFQRLFAEHPRVAALDPQKLNQNQLMLGWTQLRGELRGHVNPTKASYAIREHLDHVSKLDQATRDAIEGHWSAHDFRNSNIRTEQRARARMSSEKKQQKSSLRYQRKRERLEAGSVPPFEQLMAEHNIPHGLSPVDLEGRTAVFADRYKPKGLSTFELRKYMELRGYHQVDVDAVVGLRRRTSRRKHSQTTSKRRRERQREERDRIKDAATASTSQSSSTKSRAANEPGQPAHLDTPSERPAKKLRDGWWKASNL